jgi:hypothetical protein
MESDWHVVSISLLDELVRNHLGAPHNYFCGGNMFIYYSVQQAKEIEEYVEGETVQKKPRFKGPDFFLVKEVDGTNRARAGWCGRRTVGIPTWWWSLFPLPRARRMWTGMCGFMSVCFVCLSIFGLTVVLGSWWGIGCLVRAMFR